jgi:hypothetical protein
MAKFKEILDKIGANVLTEDTKSTIIEAFEHAVDEKVKARTQLQVTEALKQQNEDHAQKLQKLLSVIDEDHSVKLQKVVKRIDKDHSGKFQKVIEHYENLLKKEAIKFKDTLVNEVSNYIELYIDQTIPMKQIAEACENTQAKNILTEMKKLLAIDEEYVTENVREALEDGKNTITTLHKELNEAVKENVKLNQQVKGIKAELILEQKTQHMPKNKRDFVRRILNEKSPDYIKENFDYVVEMFEHNENDETELIREEAKQTTQTRHVRVPKSELIEEDNNLVNETSHEPAVNSYVSVMESQEKRYK